MNNKLTIMLAIVFSTAFANSSETVKGAEKDLAAFKQEMTIKLKSIEVEIAKLNEKAKTKSNTAQVKAVKNLEETRDKINVQLDELEKASESNWKKLKTRIAKSVEKLNARTQALLKDKKTENK